MLSQEQLAIDPPLQLPKDRRRRKVGTHHFPNPPQRPLPRLSRRLSRAARPWLRRTQGPTTFGCIRLLHSYHRIHHDNGLPLPAALHRPIQRIEYILGFLRDPHTSSCVSLAFGLDSGFLAIEDEREGDWVDGGVKGGEWAEGGTGGVGGGGGARENGDFFEEGDFDDAVVLGLLGGAWGGGGTI